MKTLIGIMLIIGLLGFWGCDNSTEPQNEPPVIASLTANPDSVEIGGTSLLTCEASDPDGDNLIYIWESTAGSISGTDSIVTWTAPNSEGKYLVSCKVDDGNGGQDIEDVYITVESEQISDQEKIDSLYNSVAYYYNNGIVSGLISLYSDSYKHNGLVKGNLDSLWTERIGDGSMNITSIKVQPTINGTLAQCVLDIYTTVDSQIDTMHLEPGDGDGVDDLCFLRNEGDDWKLYGNQMERPPNPWCVNDNVYRVYGSNIYDPPPSSEEENYSIWDLEEEDWNYIGEGNTTQEFEVDTSYSWVLITWSNMTTYYFDAITDEVAQESFGLGGYTWISWGLVNYLVNTDDSEPSNFKGDPDSIYAKNITMGFSAMTFPSSSSSISLDPVTGKGKIKIHMTTNP